MAKGLEAIDLEVKRVANRVCMRFKENDGGSYYIEKIHERAKGLEDWLKVQVSDIKKGFEIIYDL